jgi:uncharacterized cupin superfamily protein
MAQAPLVPLLAFHGGASADLGPSTPKATTRVPGQMESALEIWQQSGVESGFWECTPGTFTARRDGYTELCQFVSGDVIVTGDDGISARFFAGDTLVTPAGWSGTWEVIETVRKFYVIIPSEG